LNRAENADKQRSMSGIFDKPGSTRLILTGLACAVLGIGAGWMLQSRTPAASVGGVANRAAIEQVVRDYVLAHPEILPQAMENLRKKEDAKQLAAIKADVEKPFPGVVLGNPLGKVTLVEFSDFACGYCRQSEADVAAMIKANPDLKVVIRHLPILSPTSADAARMGLAAAAQGKYAAFHNALFAGGQLSGATIEAAARAAGLDLDRAKRDSTAPQFEAEIEANMQFAQKLGFRGTPSWVIGDEIHNGAVGRAALAEAIAKVRR
jgi:protein-disulfide isomerase